MEVEGNIYASVNKTIVDQCQSGKMLACFYGVLWNKLQWNLNPNKYNYIQLKWSENATSKLVAILSWSQCVKDEELNW